MMGEESDSLESRTVTMLDVLEWAYHVMNPCEDGEGNNVRGVYLRSVEYLLLNCEFESENAKRTLQKVYDAYKD